MLMFMAAAQLADGALGLRLMLSADPPMGPSGYPLLFQTRRDRQRPYAAGRPAAPARSAHGGGRQPTATPRPLTARCLSICGLAGEPALGPLAFMHRLSGEDNPEAPLTHHWLDSTHVSYGVVTGGYICGD